MRKLLIILLTTLLVACGSKKSSEVDVDEEIDLNVVVDWTSTTDDQGIKTNNLIFDIKLIAKSDGDFNYIEVEKENELILYVDNNKYDLLDYMQGSMVFGDVDYRLTLEPDNSAAKEVEIVFEADNTSRKVRFTLPNQIEAELDPEIVNAYNPYFDDLVINWHEDAPVKNVSLEVKNDTNTPIPGCPSSFYEAEINDDQTEHVIYSIAIDKYDCISENDLELILSSPYQHRLDFSMNDFDDISIYTNQVSKTTLITTE